MLAANFLMESGLRLLKQASFALHTLIVLVRTAAAHSDLERRLGHKEKRDSIVPVLVVS